MGRFVGVLKALSLVFTSLNSLAEGVHLKSFNDMHIDPSYGYYTYAPSVISENGKTYLWACSNPKNRYGFVDYISFYIDGKLQSQPALSPSRPEDPANGPWDALHVCDPTVVGGNFKYFDEEYNYAMFYLGTNLLFNNGNQIGLALAKNISGPWVKFPEPIVRYTDSRKWGVGQPSATAIGQGRVLLFYTRGEKTTDGFVSAMDLSRVENLKVEFVRKLTTRGLAHHPVYTNNKPIVLRNFDIAYSVKEDMFYMARETLNIDNIPLQIGNYVQLARMPGGKLWNGRGEWETLHNLTPEITSFRWNTNSGIEKNRWGQLPNSDRLKLFYTTASHQEGEVIEYNYDIQVAEYSLGGGSPREQPVQPLGAYASSCLNLEDVSKKECDYQGIFDVNQVLQGKAWSSQYHPTENHLEYITFVLAKPEDSPKEVNTLVISSRAHPKLAEQSLHFPQTLEITYWNSSMGQGAAFRRAKILYEIPMPQGEKGLVLRLDDSVLAHQIGLVAHRLRNAEKSAYPNAEKSAYPNAENSFYFQLGPVSFLLQK